MKRRPDIHNYELFFLDYLDGNLSDAEIIALENFLLENPDLRKELEGLEHTSISPEDLKHPLPENLKHIDLEPPVSNNNLDFFLIAEMEGDLTQEQSLALQEFLRQNPECEKERKIIAAAKLQPDLNVKMETKDPLRKSLFIVYRFELSVVAAMAAGIALLLTFWLGFMDRGPEIDSLALIEKDKKETISVTDSTSTTETKVEKETSPVKIPEKQQQAIKKAAAKISFKTGIPIASADISEQNEIPEEEFDPSGILKNVRIDPSHLSNISPIAQSPADPPELKLPFTNTRKPKAEDPSAYLSLGEFAVQKLTDILFPQEKKDLNAINLASAGLEKINEIAGTNMKLEASARGETEEKVLSFNSRLISFTTPINRE